MKAVLLRDTEGPENYQIEEMQIPQPGENEVLIRLRAASINRREVFISKGQYPGIKLPAIPGADGSGEIVALGKNANKFTVGTYVIVNPALNWGEQERIYQPNFSILGVPTNGTFSQYIKVPEENVFLKPEFLSWEEAAALPLAGLTAYRAIISRGNIQNGEDVLIPGIGGGVATFLLQIAVAAGGNVYVTSGKDEKIDRAIAMGAKDGVNYHQDKWEKRLRDKVKQGVDLVVDGVGGSNFVSLLGMAKHGGRIVTYGATAGSVPNLSLERLFLKQIDIIGTTMGSPRDFQNMLNLYEEKNIRPVIDSVYSLDEIIPAMKHVERGDNFGKVIISIP